VGRICVSDHGRHWLDQRLHGDEVGCSLERWSRRDPIEELAAWAHTIRTSCSTSINIPRVSACLTRFAKRAADAWARRSRQHLALLPCQARALTLSDRSTALRFASEKTAFLGYREDVARSRRVPGRFVLTDLSDGLRSHSTDAEACDMYVRSPNHASRLGRDDFPGIRALALRAGCWVSMLWWRLLSCAASRLCGVGEARRRRRTAARAR